jgi:GNAT superfamily N-acetyltransferase
VARQDVLSPVSQALIRRLDAELLARYPEKGATYFRLDCGEVAGDAGASLVAYVGAEPVGCGAVRRIGEGVGEIKRMYVCPAARGRGIGRTSLEALEGQARRLGMARLLLETGARQPEALALYRRAGYTEVPAFGEYSESPLSICMGKNLPRGFRRLMGE